MNQSLKNKSRNLADFWGTISRSSGDPLFIYSDKKYSYPLLAEDIRKTTTFLKNKNVQEGDSVLLITSHVYLAPQLFLSCLFNGVNSVILDTEIKPEFLGAVIEQTRPKIIFCDSDKFQGENSLDIPVIKIRKEQQKKGTLLGKLFSGSDLKKVDPSLQVILETLEPEEPLLPETDGFAYVLYTSGTTSSPKGVQITRKNLLTHLKTLSMYFGYSSGDRVLNILPYHHVDGFIQGPILCSFNGSLLIRPFAFSILKTDDLLSVIRQNKITHFITVPTLLSLLHPSHEEESSVFSHPEFKFIVSAAGNLEKKLWANFQDKFHVRIANLYGLTESVTGSLFCGPQEENYRLGSIGKPVDCEVKLVDDNQNEIHEFNKTGELCLKGDHIMAGYVANQTATAEILKDGWLHTGDLVSKDEDGFFWIRGRKKSVIIRGGINIYPEEISEALNAFDEVKESVTIGCEDEIWGELAVACFVPADGYSVQTDQLYNKLRSVLPSEKIPDELVELNELPKGPSGKIQIETVKKYLATLEGKKSEEKKSGDSSEMILKLAADAFKVPEAKLTLTSSPENTPGWDSLGHMVLISAIEKTFSVKLSMKEIMKVETLGHAVDMLKKKGI